jgi:hypothetical protein
MALGIALLLIFVLYLIDKHNRWRQAAKITFGLVIVALLGVASLYGWFKYDAYRTEKRQSAENAAYQAKMRPIQDCEARNSKFSNAEEECEKDPSTMLVPKKEEPHITFEQTRHSDPAQHVKTRQAIDLTTQELGSLVCAHVGEGEVATLLKTGSYGVKVKTADGKIGWGYAGFFEVVETKP